MRLGVAVAVVSLSIIGLAVGDDVRASIRRPTNIPAQGLGPALQALAKDRNFQVVYVSEEVANVRTQGAVGEFTSEEALRQLLRGTGLSYRYLDEKTVTILPTSTTSNPGTAPTSPDSAPGSSSGDTQQEGKKSSSGPFRVAQVDQRSSSDTATVKKDKESNSSEGESSSTAVEPYQVNTPEVLIVGSKVMNVDVKRTEDDVQPYYILDSTMIEQSGATNVEDFLKQRLTMNTAIQSNSQLGAGQTSVGTTSTINLRGLGANETLILIDGRRSAAVALGGFTRQTDINGIPLSAIERIEIENSFGSACCHYREADETGSKIARRAPIIHRHVPRTGSPYRYSTDKAWVFLVAGDIQPVKALRTHRPTHRPTTS